MRLTGSKSAKRPAIHAKVPPHSLEAEQSVLGGLMLDQEAWDRIVDRLHDTDFYRYEHQLIFRAMRRLAEQSKPLDVLTVSDALKATNEFETVGGDTYLFELANNTPSAANIATYADIVRERAVLRALITAAGHITEDAFNPEGRSIIELLDAAERSVFSISEQGGRTQGPVTIKDYLARTMDRIDTLFHSNSSITGMPTGYHDFDSMTSGLQSGDLVIVAGRPSMGKTTFAMNIAENVVIKNKSPVLIFSMEMSGESIVMRLLSSLCRIDQLRLRTGKLADEDWPRMSSTVSMLSEAPLFIDDTPALSPAEMRARARRLAKEQGKLGLIVVDYLQLMQVQGFSENRTAEISEISRSLKALAKELSVPVLALSQLNRSLEQRADKRPVMSDLRECVTGDTLVCLANGERIPIQELVGKSFPVLAMNESGKITQATCETVWHVGKKPVYRVHLASGRSIDATGQHRLYGANGWQTVSELRVGDRLAVVDLLNDQQLQTECQKALFWDSVVSIEPIGEQDVYDLTVPGLENWLADGIVTHNSGALEQDADLIVFIYRDEVYHENTPDKGTAEIIIAKQRNGPIGKLRLTFMGQYTCFENFIRQTNPGFRDT
jgi:replicative DNA helicase